MNSANKWPESVKFFTDRPHSFLDSIIIKPLFKVFQVEVKDPLFKLLPQSTLNTIAFERESLS